MNHDASDASDAIFPISTSWSHQRGRSVCESVCENLSKICQNRENHLKSAKPKSPLFQQLLSFEEVVKTQGLCLRNQRSQVRILSGVPFISLIPHVLGFSSLYLITA